MKRFGTVFFVAAACLVALLEGKRRLTQQFNAPVSEVEQTPKFAEAPPLSEADMSSTPAPNRAPSSVLAESPQAAARISKENMSAERPNFYPSGLLRAMQDLTPRVISIITNQLARLAPEQEEKYDRDDWHKLDYAKGLFVMGWGSALLRYAEKNGGMCPATLNQAAEFYPQDHAWLLQIFDKDRFEIVYRGSLNDLRDPASVILVRERVPTVVERLSQHWFKSYILGDGREIMLAGFDSVDEFQAFENEHTSIRHFL